MTEPVDAKVLAKLQRNSRTSAALVSIGAVFLLGTVYYSATRLEPLERQVRELEGQVLEKRKELSDLTGEVAKLQQTRDALLKDLGWTEESLRGRQVSTRDVARSLEASEARRKIAIASSPSARSKVTVQVFSRDVDRAVVLDALRELGFAVVLKNPNQNIPTAFQTNAIFCGSSVAFEDVKLVALTLLRAGVQLAAVQPLENSNGRTFVIQIGSIYPAPRESSLSVEEIQRMNRCGTG